MMKIVPGINSGFVNYTNEPPLSPEKLIGYQTVILRIIRYV